MRPRFVPIGLLLALAAALPVPVAAVEETADEPATALRVSLDRLLAEHAFLTMIVVRSAVADSPDYEAAGAALDGNSGEIVAAIEGVFGEEAGAAFAEQWHNHIGYLVDYTRALEAGDEDAASLAAEQLDRYVADFSALLAEAMPVLPDETVEGLIGEHVEQLGHVAAFEDADFGAAYPAIRETYRHMFGIGDGLVIGIVTAFPDRFGGREQAFSPASDLRLTLDRLFGEHTYLAALAMRATLHDAPDLASAADALAENSAELQATIADIYGAPAGEAFGTLWDSHVGAYFAYVTALAQGDAAAADTALASLTDYHHEFSAFVADANPFLTQAVLEGLVRVHTDHLVAQADAHAVGDYADAHRIGREAYAHTAELSAALAAAIGDQFPQRFPDAATGAPQSAVPAALTALVVGGVLVVIRARRISA